MIFGIRVQDLTKKQPIEVLVREAMAAYERRFQAPATVVEISDKVVQEVTIEGVEVRKSRIVPINEVTAGVPIMTKDAISATAGARPHKTEEF